MQTSPAKPRTIQQSPQQQVSPKNSGCFSCFSSVFFRKIEKEKILNPITPPYGHNCQGDSPLHTLVRNGELDELKSLLRTFTKNKSSFQNVNIMNDEGFTPLTLAVLLSPECVPILLAEASQVDVNILFPIHETTALIESIKQKNYIAMRSLLRHPAADVNKPDPSTGFSPLMLALYNCDLIATRALLEKKEVQVNQHPWQSKAQTSNHESYVDLYSPALVAIESSFTEGLKLLIEREDFAINNQTEPSGMSPIFFAVGRNNLAAVNILLKSLKLEKTHKLNINIQTNVGRGLLHIVCQMNLNELLKEILADEESNANIQTHETKTTPLHYAVFEKHEETVRILINSGKVDIFSRHSHYGSAPQLAEKKDFEEVKKVFREYFTNHHSIHLSNFPHMQELLNQGEIPLPDKKNINNFTLLNQLKNKIPSLTSIQFKETFLLEPTIDERICVAYFLQTKDKNANSASENREDIDESRNIRAASENDKQADVTTNNITKTQLFIEFFDRSFYEQYIFTDSRHPSTRQQLFNYFNFEKGVDTNMCHILKKSMVEEIEKSLGNQG